MGFKENLKKHIRGWIPKESTLTAAQEPTKTVKALWYVVVVAVLALMVALVIVFYIPFLTESSINRTIALVVYAAMAVAVYLAFGRDYYRRHPKERRVRIIITSGLLMALTVAIALSLRIGPLPPYFWIYIVLLFAIGVFASDRILKKIGGAQP
ncbi:MAG: hypothetical protein NWF00_01855 [Candidatus Bathyarchaeota archaeon]|nr:hypothetical protein [Candidatus Bathyarchaeota archaeon]